MELSSSFKDIPAGSPADVPHQVEGHALQQLAVAWAAGFADGEGCISIALQKFSHGRRPTHRLRFDLVQNNREVLVDFAAAVGVSGPLYATKRTTLHNRQLYHLVYDGMSAYEVICRLAPFLRRKRPEAEVAMAYVREARVGWHPGPNGFPEELWALRDWYRLKLQRLK